jgi:hypothetical protein
MPLKRPFVAIKEPFCQRQEIFLSKTEDKCDSFNNKNNLNKRNKK